LASSRKSLRIARKKRKVFSRKEGIEASELERRKGAGECLYCAWPPDRKGAHRVKDCIRRIRLDIGTASYPKGKIYQKKEASEPEPESNETSKEEDSTSEE
jgi:hypothetical protein